MEYRPELTAIVRKEITRPLRIALEHGLIKKTDRVLDYGSGKSMDCAYLDKNGITCIRYDRYYQPERPVGMFDVIMCTYVLNVVPPQEQEAIVTDMMSLLKPFGRIVIAVRTPSEILREATEHHWECQPSGYITSRGTYQIGIDENDLIRLLVRNYPGGILQIDANVYVYEDRDWK